MTSQLMVESRIDRAENAKGLGWGCHKQQYTRIAVAHARLNFFTVFKPKTKKNQGTIAIAFKRMLPVKPPLLKRFYTKCDRYYKE